MLFCHRKDVWPRRGVNHVWRSLRERAGPRARFGVSALVEVLYSHKNANTPERIVTQRLLSHHILTITQVMESDMALAPVARMALDQVQRHPRADLNFLFPIHPVMENNTTVHIDPEPCNDGVSNSVAITTPSDSHDIQFPRSQATPEAAPLHSSLPPCSAAQSIGHRTPFIHGNGDDQRTPLASNKAAIHCAKRQKTQDVPGAQPRRDIPSEAEPEDQLRHHPQQFVGNFGQAQNHGTEDTSPIRLFCNHEDCFQKEFQTMSKLLQHIWKHSKGKQRECTCTSKAPASLKMFNRHREEFKCGRLDPQRTPDDIGGMKLYGYFKSEKEYTFDTVSELK